MCSNCQQNNCGCSETTVSYHVCNTCPPDACACPVKLSTDCVTFEAPEPLSCSGIEPGTILTDVIQQLDEYICTAIDQINASINIVNVGAGAEVYKGIDGIGRRELKTITSTNNSVTINENTDTINLSVSVPTDQNNFVRFLIINPNDLPSNYTEQDVCDYVLALPSGQRTILETDSKWNIIIGNSIS